MVLEIAGDDLIEVYTIFADDVVQVTGIVVAVGVSTSIDRSLDEALSVLPEYDVVCRAVDEEQSTLEILGTERKIVSLVSLGVLLGTVVVTLAIHRLVAAPVDDGTSCHGNLEGLGMREDQIGRHEASEAPAVDAHTVGIDVGESLEEVNALHLVSHLLSTYLTVYDLLEGGTSLGTASAVDREDDVDRKSVV